MPEPVLSPHQGAEAVVELTTRFSEVLYSFKGFHFHCLVGPSKLDARLESPKCLSGPH